MNIAVTAIGSMSSEAVIKSLRKNSNHRIIGFDIYPQEWIVTSKLVDSFYQVPLAKNKEYIEYILEICHSNKVDFVIPLTDPEIDVLCMQIQHFRNKGITICCPYPHSTQIARDKFNLFNFFKQNSEILVIPTFESVDDIDINKYNNIIAKPRKGRSSEGLIKSSNKKHLQNAIDQPQDYIFQPCIDGSYITVDTIRDKFKNQVSIFRKELLRTVNGAGVVIELFKDDKLNYIVNQITESLDIIGCVNVEFILFQGRYFLMDINPRFSAGISFSIIAGYDFVGNHLKCFQGLPIAQEIAYKQQIISKRYVDIIHI
ncbi:ATP-grasp domain-containing protein [Anabaenopsis arnoldii]|uniref:ATP-grasp domain-containing protein n=1 Tax=Anabaenopsis arnoldii TaxID=2152938 RepID=A0ABT5AMQ5_9CYAN|nr:ATP-grasp domain-containing protein [Anabaenopsis arnoldii]MDB9538589.1 ATP-grasp domain-containing protein [Anabaenopsis arnoldii]MDH6090862.1 ATP-grasp domain-containing protein [Anabaenopsis arnoldii]